MMILVGAWISLYASRWVAGPARSTRFESIYSLLLLFTTSQLQDDLDAYKLSTSRGSSRYVIVDRSRLDTDVTV